MSVNLTKIPNYEDLPQRAKDILERMIRKALDDLYSNIEDQILDLETDDFLRYMPETDNGDDEDRWGEAIGGYITDALLDYLS
jgi:hypothetical protein